MVTVWFISLMTKVGFLGGWLSGKESACQCRVRSLGLEVTLEKEMTTYSSVLAWKTSRPEKPGGLQSMGLQKNQTRLSE